jgi:hypothetical protein
MATSDDWIFRCVTHCLHAAEAERAWQLVLGIGWIRYSLFFVKTDAEFNFPGVQAEKKKSEQCLMSRQVNDLQSQDGIGVNYDLP